MSDARFLTLLSVILFAGVAAGNEEGRGLWALIAGFLAGLAFTAWWQQW